MDPPRDITCTSSMFLRYEGKRFFAICFLLDIMVTAGEYLQRDAMERDLTDILNEWPYDPEDNIRIVDLAGGRRIMQVRLPLGIEQYELDGRPDEVRPFGMETMLEKIKSDLSDYILKQGNDEGFSISQEDFLLLQNEGILYYYRYLHLFQLGDHERTVRDTEHNLEICDLVEKYTEQEAEALSILQYKPYIYRMNAVSRAMISINQNMKKIASETLQNAIETIDKMEEIDSPAFRFEKLRSIQYLKSTLSQIDENKDDPIEELKAELEEAVDAEEYELAADIRDRLQELSRFRDDRAGPRGPAGLQ